MARRPRRDDAATLDFIISADPVRAAFQRRTLSAFNRIASEAPTESLTSALASATDVGALACVLGDSDGIGAAVLKLEPLAPLIARNAEHRDELLAMAGGTLTSDEAGTLLGISRQSVDRRRRTNCLLALRRHGDWQYPRCRFAEASHEVVAGFPTLLAAFSVSVPNHLESNE